jgi:uncharacterized protein
MDLDDWPPCSLDALPPEGDQSAWGGPVPTEALHIEVVFAAAPHDVRSAAVTLSAGATVADALRASRLLEGMDADAADALQAGIWGRAAARDARLRDGDRVELTRALLVDPKQARRLRYRRDGVRKDKPGLKTRGSPTP